MERWTSHASGRGAQMPSLERHARDLIRLAWLVQPKSGPSQVRTELSQIRSSLGRVCFGFGSTVAEMDRFGFGSTGPIIHDSLPLRCIFRVSYFRFFL